MVLKEEDDVDVVLVDDDLEGALGGGGDFGVHWEGGVVTSSSLVRSTKRGFDGGLTEILGFLEMQFVDLCMEDMVSERYDDEVIMMKMSCKKCLQE